MIQKNTSLEDIWSHATSYGDEDGQGHDPADPDPGPDPAPDPADPAPDPGPDPYANCNSCDQACSNSGLNPAPANFNNVINDFLQKAQNNGELENYIDQCSTQDAYRVMDQLQNSSNKNSVQDPNYYAYPRLVENAIRGQGGGSSSSAGMEIDNQSSNSNPTGGGLSTKPGATGLRLYNDSVSWKPSQDVQNFRAEGYVNKGQALEEALGFGAKALRTATAPTPENAQQNNCDTGGGEEVKKATPTSEGLGGSSSASSTSSSRVTGTTGGGTSAAGGGSINSNPVNSNGTAPPGNASGRGKK